MRFFDNSTPAIVKGSNVFGLRDLQREMDSFGAKAEATIFCWRWSSFQTPQALRSRRMPSCNPAHDDDTVRKMLRMAAEPMLKNDRLCVYLYHGEPSASPIPSEVSD